MVPFRGSEAVAAGLVTPGELRGPRYRTLFRDVFVRLDGSADPDDLLVRALGAAVLVRGRGVLGGWAAAEVLGASCGPADAPVEVIVPGGGMRDRPRLVVRKPQLRTDEVTAVGGTPVVVPCRAAYDLARRLPMVDAVVAVDALTHRFAFPASTLLAVAPPGARNRTRLPEVVRRADPRAASPMETRIRLAIEDGRLPLPTLQHPVGPYALDLAYPMIKLGVEYDGREHLTPERARRDLDRQAYLTARGWAVLRFCAHDVLHRPRRVAARVRGALIDAARERDMSLAELRPLLINWAAPSPDQR